MDTADRLIGILEGDNPGPLIIAVGAIHGNEPAGVTAIKGFLDEVKKLQSVFDIQINGTFIGLVGNIAAFNANIRYSNYDLNRCWSVERIRSMTSHFDEEVGRLEGEELEMYSIIKLLLEVVERYTPTEVVVLDLHTTSAASGVFSIPLELDNRSLALAASLPAPIVLGLASGFVGTFLQGISVLLSNSNFVEGTIRGLAFEAGQHQEEASIQRALWVLHSVVREVGLLDWRQQPDVEARAVLFNLELPRVTRIFYKHEIRPGTFFRMNPGYVNFQYIQKGEPLAMELSESVVAPASGYLLMPLYQPKGSDGFFLAAEAEANW